MNKWLKITLVSLLVLVVLAGVGAAGYRLGLTQNPEFIKQMAELRAQRYDQWQKQQALPQPPIQSGNANPPVQGNAPQPNGGKFNPGQGFDPRGNFGQGFNPHERFDRRNDRGRGDSHFFGLLHLVVFGGLLWFGYKYAKNSGWRLVREPQPAPPVVESAPVEEQKKSKK